MDFWAPIVFRVDQRKEAITFVLRLLICVMHKFNLPKRSPRIRRCPLCELSPRNINGETCLSATHSLRSAVRRLLSAFRFSLFRCQPTARKFSSPSTIFATAADVFSPDFRGEKLTLIVCILQLRAVSCKCLAPPSHYPNSAGKVWAVVASNGVRW